MDNVVEFMSEVEASNFITGEELIKRVGLDPTNLQFSDEPWLKFNVGSKELYIPKKTYLHSVSMDELLKHNLVYGDRTINIDNDEYIIRLLTDEEWEQTIKLAHTEHDYTNEDLHIHYSYGYGATSWLQDSKKYGLFKVRGYFGVSFFYFGTSSDAGTYVGWRPVLVRY